MSPSERIFDHDCGQDAAVYVLGALEPDEAAAFRRHLETCVVCRDEVATLRTVADTLPLAAPQIAIPRSLKRKVMKGVKEDAKKRAATWSRRLALTSLAGRPATALAGLAAAAVVALGVVELVPGGSSASRSVRASVPGSSGVVSLRVSGTSGELIVDRMPQPPAGRIYEVWLKRGDKPPAPTSALFGVTSSGAATVEVPGNLRGVSQVLVTPEPLGGSQSPTHAPVIIARVPKL